MLLLEGSEFFTLVSHRLPSCCLRVCVCGVHCRQEEVLAAQKEEGDADKAMKDTRGKMKRNAAVLVSGWGVVGGGGGRRGRDENGMMSALLGALSGLHSLSGVP